MQWEEVQQESADAQPASCGNDKEPHIEHLKFEATDQVK